MNLTKPIVTKDNMNSNKVLVSEFCLGVSLEHLAKYGSQRLRDYFGYLVMKNTLEELFIFNFMQSDPNFSNFFFDIQNR